MFETLPSPSFEMILLVGRALLLFGAFWVFGLAFIRWRRADERSSQRLAAQLERNFAEIRSLHETIAVMGSRLDSLGERSDTENRYAPVSVGAGVGRGYELATRLARNGSGIEDLIANCGLTRQEAELLLRVQGSNGRPAPTERARHTAAPEPARATQAPVKRRGSMLSVVG